MKFLEKYQVSQYGTDYLFDEENARWPECFMMQGDLKDEWESWVAPELIPYLEPKQLDKFWWIVVKPEYHQYISGHMTITATGNRRWTF